MSKPGFRLFARRKPAPSSTSEVIIGARASMSSWIGSCHDRYEPPLAMHFSYFQLGADCRIEPTLSFCSAVHSLWNTSVPLIGV
jgi:hypothetical protein